MEHQLPHSYQKYLDDARPELIGTLRPVLLESVAEGDTGVIVRFMGSEIHAMTSETVPFGEIREEHME